MKSFTLPVVLLLLLSVFATRLSRAADGGNQPLDVGPQARFSADNFDWREMIPYLSAAAARHQSSAGELEGASRLCRE